MPVICDNLGFAVDFCTVHCTCGTSIIFDVHFVHCALSYLTHSLYLFFDMHKMWDLRLVLDFGMVDLHVTYLTELLVNMLTK